MTTPLVKPHKSVPLRDPEHVMRLARLGAFHQSRLSFMRILFRRMVRENWTFSRPVFDIDDAGVGTAVYQVDTPHRSYALVAFAHDLPAAKRSDRVIAEAWDSTFTLFDGVPTQADIDRLRQNIPLQEAGRITQSELSMSRANRSVRLWDHVVARLAAGQQPDAGMIKDVGYLMRTTAVYGSGKFGAADREVIAERPECAAPFQIEMLSVYLIRTYVRDLVQHMADARGQGQAARLDPDLARQMGIGNSTGLGMAPFLINHPKLLHNWIAAREAALAAVRGVHRARGEEIAQIRTALHRAVLSAQEWQSQHPIQIEKLEHLRADLQILVAHMDQADLDTQRPWDRLFIWAEAHLGADAQECLASVLLEPYESLVDHFGAHMGDSDRTGGRIDGAMTLDVLRGILSDHYAWALSTDWAARPACARAWYVSQEKLEPRLGERFEEHIEPYEQPLAPGRDAAALTLALGAYPGDSSVAQFLLRHPEHRHAVRRAQIVARAPYAEIRDNTIGADLLPIDMLRCKLSFFGATQFDPRSDRWVRVCLFGHAPYPDELTPQTRDDWQYPELGASLARA